ncbi:stalk domain-containing protein [Paenibacillus sp. FA6]|uniref:stalk domain-containing protein n=1 Tax=Paenibacillus sp. FA6 TaxID=3413029 RepID=UPI003F6552F3
MKTKKWVVATTAVCVLLGTSVIVFASNPIKLIINGNEHYTETPPQIIDGRVMVPLTTISDTFNKVVSYNANTKEVEIKDAQEEVISELDHIKITGQEGDNGIYENLQIVTDQFSRSLGGYNVTNPTYAPEIIFVDLNGDGNNEIAVILTIGYGTGVLASEVQLRDGKSGVNIPVEDALIAFKKQTVLPNTMLNSEREQLFEEPVIGSVIRYYVVNNILKASAAVEISPGEFIGELEIEYTYVNGVYVAGEATFSKYED